MAPTKIKKRKEATFLKEIFMFKHAKKGVPDPTFVSLHNCKRSFGFDFTDFTLEEVQQVVWGVRCGQQGYFVPPKIVASVKFRVDMEFIPDDWVSATFLRKCFERKNGEPAGYIDSFLDEYARLGKKKHHKGAAGYFFPRRFLQVTLDTAIIKDRKVVKFLDSPKPGMYRQKALDLSFPPALPKNIFLHRARGIDDIEIEDDDDREGSEEATDEESQKSVAEELNNAIGGSGDIN